MPPLQSAPPLCTEPKLVVKVMEEGSRMPIGGAIVTITTEHPETLSVIRSVTLETRVTGLVEDKRFVKEELRISVKAFGFGTQSRQLKFTCEDGGCLDCVWTEIFLLARNQQNQTLCPDVEAVALFLDNTTQEPVPFVVFDVFKFPILCPQPGSNLSSTGNQTEAETETEPTTSPVLPPTTLPPPVFIVTQPSDETSLLDVTSRKLDTQLDCTPLLTSSGLRASQKGEAKFPVQSPASYLVVARPHPGYPTPPTTSAHLNCSTDCSNCQLQLVVNLVKPACDVAVLAIHVRGRESDEHVSDAKVIVFLGQVKFTEEPLTTDNKGEVKLEVVDRATYSVVVQAAGYESLQVETAILCDLQNCTDCTSVLTFDLPRIVANETLSCPENETATLSLSILDKVTKLPPTNLSISLTFLPLASCPALSSLALKTPHVHSFWRKSQIVGTWNKTGRALSIKECRDECKSHQDCFFFTLELPDLCWTKNSMASTLLEYRNSTDPSYCPWTSLVSPSQCSPSKPCRHGQGVCNVDADCAKDLICGRENCPTPGHKAADRCCQTSHGLRPGLLLAHNVPSLHRPVEDSLN